MVPRSFRLRRTRPLRKAEARASSTGYGLGPVAGATIPADLTITVGGQPATILGFNSGAYGLASPPFQLEAVAFSIPPGTAGTSVAMTVSNSSGTTTANAAFSYLPPIQIFNTGPTELAQGIYDHLRDVYYFTSATQVLVFSKTQGRLLAPIDIPASQRLWGIALSPDGSKLAIADAAANAIYLLNPDTPATVNTFPLPGSFPPVQGVITNPAGVSVSNAGMVYYTLTNQGGTGFHGFFSWIPQRRRSPTTTLSLPVSGRMMLCCARPSALTARACTLTMPARYTQ